MERKETVHMKCEHEMYLSLSSNIEGSVLTMSLRFHLSLDCLAFNKLLLSNKLKKCLLTCRC